MRVLIIFVLFVGILSGCSQSDIVRISGRVENGDSVVSIWVEDSIYSFPLDENDFFAGKIIMKKRGYATLLHNSLNLYLSPDEDLELYVNALNFSGSLYFRGSLGGINSYLKEQEVAVFFDKDFYTLDENEFIEKMKDLIDEKTKLLEAKNFDPDFTRLETERIRYSVAERVSLYPVYRQRMYPDMNYTPGASFKKYLSSFSLNNEALFGTRDYRSFLLNYVYFQNSYNGNGGKNSSGGIADYILSTITNPTIKDFLLTEIVYRYIWENNGLNGADYLLEVFRRECTDKSKIAYINEVIEMWEKILPGREAPSFSVIGMEGKKINMKDFKGSYLYISVWATWCVPCKSELPYLNMLNKLYYDRNIKFLTIAIDDKVNCEKWKNFMNENPLAGIHAFSDEKSGFSKDYMIISVPRFILIGPDGKIINSNAPRPSGQLRQYIESFDI